MTGVRPMDGANRRFLRAGFSLVEVLVVIALIVLIAGFSSSALRGLVEGSSQQKAMIGIGAALEGARQTAVARGTYTWVGMTSERDSETNQNVVTVASFASRDGTRGASVSEAQNLQLLAKVETFPGVILDTDPESLANFGNQLPSVDPDDAGARPERPDGASFNPDSDDLPPPHRKTYDWVVLFTPRGEASIETGTNPSGVDGSTGDNVELVKAIEFAIVPAKGPSPTDIEKSSTAAVRINGLSGQVDVYQPQVGN